MTNERLRAALLKSAITLDDLAAHVGVDPKTAERWVSQGRTPHRTHRLTTAQLLKADDAYLWPNTANDPRANKASHAELVQFWPARASVPTDIWLSLTASAVESIDLMAFAASFLHDSLPDLNEHLEDRIQAGVRLRLLFGDPDSQAVETRGREERIGDGMPARVRLTWSYFEPLIETAGVEARRHGQTLYASLFRFDEDLLVNPHTLGQPASQSPVFHFRHIPGGRLFRHHMKGFEQAWDASQ